MTTVTAMAACWPKEGAGEKWRAVLLTGTIGKDRSRRLFVVVSLVSLVK